eukprot:1614611-Karenia_brevis.AAC.1
MDHPTGRPKLLVQQCKGKGPPRRIFKIASEDRLLPFVRIREWPCPDTRPYNRCSTGISKPNKGAGSRGPNICLDWGCWGKGHSPTQGGQEPP